MIPSVFLYRNSVRPRKGGQMSAENNYEALAYEAVRLEITMGDNPYKAEDFPMYVAKRDGVSPMLRI